MLVFVKDFGVPFLLGDRNRDYLVSERAVVSRSLNVIMAAQCDFVLLLTSYATFKRDEFRSMAHNVWFSSEEFHRAILRIGQDVRPAV